MRPGRAARVWRLAGRLGRVLEGLAKSLGPVIAAFWIAYQYQQSQADKRVEATLGYVNRYENADTSVGKAQRALTASLWDHADEIADLRVTQASAADLTRVKATIAGRVLDGAAAAYGRFSVGPLDELDDFYNALVTCVQGGVCDSKTAVQFFGCASSDLFDNFGSAMEVRDKVAARFGWGIRWIAARADEAKTCGS